MPEAAEPIPLVIDPVTVSVSSKFSFSCRAAWESRPIIARGEVSHVGVGAFYSRSTEGMHTTSAISHPEANNQGSIVLPNTV